MTYNNKLLEIDFLKFNVISVGEYNMYNICNPTFIFDEFFINSASYSTGRTLL